MYVNVTVDIAYRIPRSMSLLLSYKTRCYSFERQCGASLSAREYKHRQSNECVCAALQTMH